MNRPVIWSENALADLEASVAFVAETNLAYATKLAVVIRATGDSLGLHDTGRPGRVAGYREKSMTGIGYVLAYSVDETRPSSITIVRVIHSSQNWPKNRWPSHPNSP